MPNYYYKCPNCGHLYNEYRLAEESPFFTKCDKCKDVDYIEITE